MRIYGEEELADGTIFCGWCDAGGAPYSGELRFPDGHQYSGCFYSGCVRKDGNTCLPHDFGRMIYPDGRIYEGDWTGGEYDGYGSLILPGKGLEVKLEGPFHMGVPRSLASGYEVEIRAWIRRAGERDFRQVYYSVGDLCFPGSGTGGYAKFTYADGSVYKGKWDSCKKENGSLYTTDGREYVFDRSGLPSVKDLETLNWMDQEWELFQVTAPLEPITYGYTLEEYLKMLDNYDPPYLERTVLTQLNVDNSPEALPEYPYGQSRRLLAFCNLPPSRKLLLTREERKSLQQLLREVQEYMPEQALGELDLRKLEERVQREEISPGGDLPIK